VNVRVNPPASVNARVPAFPALPLEDTAADILAKAIRGLGFAPAPNPDFAALARATRLSPAQIRAALAADSPAAPPPENILRALAPPLALDPDALVALANGNSAPPPLPPLPNFAAFNTPFDHGLTVNNFLVWDTATCDAVLFDTGTDPTALFDALQRLPPRPGPSLRLRHIFLTHAHRDHIAALDRILFNPAASRATIHLDSREPLSALDLPATLAAEVALFNSATSPAPSLTTASLTIHFLDASGHSPGQTAYLLHGLARPVLIAGDALFSGSMGGAAPANYLRQRANTLSILRALPENTLIAPGHGPLTTVAHELRHNPLFCNPPLKTHP
jgi:glyoxylase-like metal-dependent hydrolase (beta-lactamase superfamily II)